jgi:hypothetical protein
MYLGSGNQINKGERFTMNIHTMSAQPYNIFSNPESRRQAIQQFAVIGIDVKSKEHLLNLGHWDVKRLPDHACSKSLESYYPSDNIDKPLERIYDRNIIDDVEMKKSCIALVRDFYNDGADIDFAEKGLIGRCEIVSDFYESVKETMGIDAELSFANKPENVCGGYNPSTNSIELNARYLENPDCKELMNTILHESRHAFQQKCIDNPSSVTIKENVIDVWADNMRNYIPPGLDFEAYENQEIEKDANYFADSVMRKGEDYLYA